jgi:hypothetical protein
MPRDGSLTLSDIREPALAIGCERCGRHGRYNVQRLIAAHGADAKLTDLLVALADCEKARSFSIHDRCKAKFEGFSLRLRPFLNHDPIGPLVRSSRGARIAWTPSG